MANPYVKVGPWTNGVAPFLSAANLTLLDDGIWDAHNQPCAAVYHSVSQSIADNTTTTLAFDTEDFDTDTMHDNATNNSRLTATRAGKYSATAVIEFAAGVTGVRRVDLVKNAGSNMCRVQVQAVTVAAQATAVEVSALVSLAAADYLEVQVLHTQGSALNVTKVGVRSPRFQMARVG